MLSIGLDDFAALFKTFMNSFPTSRSSNNCSQSGYSSRVGRYWL